MEDPGPWQFGEVRVGVQRSTVETYDGSKTDPEGAITESIERLAAARRPRVAKGAPLRPVNAPCRTPRLSFNTAKRATPEVDCTVAGVSGN